VVSDEVAPAVLLKSIDYKTSSHVSKSDPTTTMTLWKGHQQEDGLPPTNLMHQLTNAVDPFVVTLAKLGLLNEDLQLGIFLYPVPLGN